MPKLYSISTTTVGEARDVAARFEPEPMVGPMNSLRSEIIARSIADILVVDPATTVRVREGIVPIDAIGRYPDYTQQEPSQVIIETEVPQEELFAAFRANEDAVLTAVEGAM